MKKVLKVLSIVLIIIILILMFVKGVNFLNKRKYEKEKEKQIIKMVSYITSKYNIAITKNDCIYYKTEDYSFHSDLFGTGKNYNIPYVSIFKNGNDKITVINRKNVFSDNMQLEMINTYIGDYFGKIINHKVKFVEFKKVYNGNIKDDTLNDYIQTDFNKFVDDSNIDEFVEGILKKDDLKIIFYIKEEDNINLLIKDVTSKLNYLKDNENIKSIVFYIYDKNEELDITFYNAELDDDYYDSYKFGHYIVNNDIEHYYSEKIEMNNFIYRGFFNLDRGYNAPQDETEIINNWFIYKLK